MLKSINRLIKERLEKGGLGSGRYPKGSGRQGELPKGQKVIVRDFYDPKKREWTPREGEIIGRVRPGVYAVRFQNHTSQVSEEYIKPAMASSEKMTKGGLGSGRYPKGSGEPKETASHQALVEHINGKDWWRTSEPDEQAVKDRGLFYASTYKEAEFYGRPQDEPARVGIKNPLVGDEQTIASALGVKVLKPDGPNEERFAMDKKMKQLAEAKGYDSIALMTPAEYKNYFDTGKMPRSIELNVFPSTKEKMAKGGPGSGRHKEKEGGVVTTPDLSSVDTSRLSPIEQREFERLSRDHSKEEALQVIINTVEGDWSQLSEQLKSRAEKDTTWKMVKG